MTEAARDEMTRIADAAAQRFGGESAELQGQSASDAPLPADDLAVGSYVYSRAVRGAEGETARHGMTVDVGLDANDSRPYAIVLCEDGPWRVDVRKWASTGVGTKQLRTGQLRRLYLDDLDATLTQPPDVLHSHAAARLACLTAGIGVGGKRGGMFGAEHLEMMLYAGTLLEAAGAQLEASR